MKIKHDRLPKDVSEGYFEHLISFFLEDFAEKENVDLTDAYCIFGRTDDRGNFKIEIQIDSLCNSYKNSMVNSWSGFQTMWEMIAFLEGYRNAIRGW